MDVNTFGAAFLHDPQAVTIGKDVMATSARGQLLCGEIRKADVVCCAGRIVGEVVRLYASGNGAIAVALHTFQSTGNNTVWSKTEVSCTFVDAGDVVSAVPWAPLSGGRIRIVPPAIW